MLMQCFLIKIAKKDLKAKRLFDFSSVEKALDLHNAKFYKCLTLSV